MYYLMSSQYSPTIDDANHMSNLIYWELSLNYQSTVPN